MKTSLTSKLQLLMLMVGQALVHAQSNVETLEHVYGPFNLRSDSLQQVPPVMEIVFPDDLWLVGYRTADG